MAIGTPSESPAIVVKELDRSGVVPNVQTTTGAFVGNFNWGPVKQATLVSNESALAETFGSPDSSNTIDFHSAAYFLRYANTMQVVREVTSAAFNSLTRIIFWGLILQLAKLLPIGTQDFFLKKAQVYFCLSIV